MTPRPLSAFLARLIWLCMAPPLLLALWLAWDSLEEQEARHLREGADEAQNFALAIDQHLRARINALHMLAISPLVDDPRRWPELYAEAQGFRESFGIHVIFADHDRQMLFNTRQPYGVGLPRLPDSKGKTAAPLALATGQPQVGDIVLGPVAKQPLVAIAVPVQRENQPTRLMLSIFETEKLQQRVDALALPADWSITLLDGTGADIARRSPPGFDGARDVADDHRFVVRSKLSPWSVVVEIPRSIHWATQLRSLPILAVAIALATLLGLLGGTLASRRIGRQMQMLLQPVGTGAPLPEIAEVTAIHEQLARSSADLRDSEARFTRLFHEAPVPLCFVDKDGVLRDRNRRFDQLFGYGHEELRSLDDWWRLAYPDPAYRAWVLETWHAVVAAAAESGSDIAPIEYKVRCKDGSERIVLVSGIVLGDDFLATLFDLTERSQAAQAQAELVGQLRGARTAALNRMEEANAARRSAETSAARLHLLAAVVERIAAVRDLPSLMGVVRPVVRQLTGADGATLVLNDNGACFYADEDAIGPLWKGQRFPLESCISGWVMLHAEPAVVEDIHADPRIPHEAYRPTFVKSLVMMPVGRTQPVAAIGAYWATRHKASGEELELHRALADAMSIGLANINQVQNLERRVAERTAELTAANQELDAFAYAVSHDLRAPLRAMGGFATALQEDYGDQLAGEASNYLEQIGIAAHRMGELIDGILALSRSTRGELQRDSVDMSALATRHLAELARAEPERQVAASVEAGLVARGDARMIDAVLGNLLGNAWKYTAKTAAARIRVYRGEVEGKQGFCIADNGAGFDMAHAGRLFKPFQRLHRQEEFPGIGIGLATVQRIVRRHGGEIVAAGSPGRGATICFTLPEETAQEIPS